METDETGKVHGELPKPQDIKDKDLEESIEALEESLKIREEEQIDFGEHGPHRERIRREQDLLRSLKKRKK